MDKINLDNINKEEIIWDFDLKNEFVNRKIGNGFVIDMYDGVPYLSLYKMKRRISETVLLDVQPPKELLEKALVEQGIINFRDDIYSITPSLKNWIKENLF